MDIIEQIFIYLLQIIYQYGRRELFYVMTLISKIPENQKSSVESNGIHKIS